MNFKVAPCTFMALLPQINDSGLGTRELPRWRDFSFALSLISLEGG